MLIELIKGVALLPALSLLQSINSRLWREQALAGPLSSGVLFGVICFVGANPKRLKLELTESLLAGQTA